MASVFCFESFEAIGQPTRQTTALHIFRVLPVFRRHLRARHGNRLVAARLSNSPLGVLDLDTASLATRSGQGEGLLQFGGRYGCRAISVALRSERGIEDDRRGQGRGNDA